MSLYQVKNFSFTYPKHNKPAISELDLTIANGQFITLCGHSGCG